MPRRNRRRRPVSRTFQLNQARNQVQRILHRYARRLSDGRHLAHCLPTESEVRRGFPSLGRTGKVIYDTRDRAALAANEMRQLDGRRMAPYECPRGGDGHWHLQSRYHALGQ